MNDNLKEYIENYLNYKLTIDETYSYEKAKEDVIAKLHAKNDNKILQFNKNIEYSYDSNNMPKIIHFTVKNKKNIDNPTWKECFSNFIKMYPDYKIILYDNNDIYNIIKLFDNKNLEFIHNIKKGAVLADIFRYLILYLRGGYYSDMDCFPVKRIDELSDQQYHGDKYNFFYVHQSNSSSPCNESNFYTNPCNNCQILGVFNNGINSKTAFRCKGHKYINDKTNIIVCYEFQETWHPKIVQKNNNKESWTDNNIGICQWFIGSKPKEKLFLECYKKSLQNSKNINYDDKNNYHFKVINSTGPLFFTKIINNYIDKLPGFKDTITILPSDYFCCGSGFNGDTVPSTKNKFVHHKFTGTWLK
jgi:mannosyltransferase OCH1-like enzyme